MPYVHIAFGKIWFAIIPGCKLERLNNFFKQETMIRKSSLLISSFVCAMSVWRNFAQLRNFGIGAVRS